MAISNFIPAVWSARVLLNLHKAQVYAALCNRDYEGEISDKGDRVKINNIGAVTISTYTKNTDINAPEALTDAQRELVIDQAKYFNFVVDDVDKVQTMPKVMDTAMQEAGYGIADVADSFVASLYTGIDVNNQIGTDAAPIIFTSVGDAYDKLVELRTTLNNANVSSMGRWVVLPSWYAGNLLKDNRIINNLANDPDSGMAIKNGYLGRYAGFDIYESNNVPNTAGTKYKVIAGYPGALSYADQINSVEAYRPEKRFGDAVKGLHLYGAKLVRPTGLAVMTANKF